MNIILKLVEAALNTKPPYTVSQLINNPFKKIRIMSHKDIRVLNGKVDN